MEQLRERGMLVRRISEDMLNSQVIAEVQNPVVMEAIKDYLLENPVELIKSMYIVSNLNLIVIDNVNDRKLNIEDMKFISEVDCVRLKPSTVCTFEYILEDINKTEEANTLIAERVIDSEDFGFAKDIYEYDSQYFDNWTYGDIIKLSTIAQTPQFIEAFIRMFNSMNANDIYNTVLRFIEDDLGLEVKEEGV